MKSSPPPLKLQQVGLGSLCELIACYDYSRVIYLLP